MGDTRSSIRFVFRGREVEVADAGPTTMLLDYLRLTERATGTKEGCNEGDCGACTVVLRRLRGDKLVYEPVNSCILTVGQVDGCEVITVEDLAEEGRLHPVQDAMAGLGGSQCGFCTPGFVMALFAHVHDGASVTRDKIADAVAGNLCRCTGYRPILDAGAIAAASRKPDRFDRNAAAARVTLKALDDDADLMVGTRERFFAAPRTVESLGRMVVEHPDATILAGGTDVGLWVTKKLKDLPKIISIGRVRGLDAIEETATDVSFGAAVTHEAARPVLAAIDPDLGEIWRRFASVQVRASGTVCGNIANGSPIGDGPPALIALGATVTLRRGEATRTLPLEDYFVAYGRQERRPGEFVEKVTVPRVGAGQHFRAFKVSKRFDQDISAVMMGLRVTLDAAGAISETRLAFGGMAATPKRALLTETALKGIAPGDEAAIQKALDALAQDFTPISDMRASAWYRTTVARNLVLKALLEIAGTAAGATRLIGMREGLHAA